MRPEIFTAFFLVIFLALLQRQRIKLLIDSTASTSSSIDKQSLTAMTLLMVLWCNLHTGFVIGIALLAIYSIAFYIEDHLSKRLPSGATKTVFSGLIACLFASLFNPYGAGLWLYLPHLFFAAINRHIPECNRSPVIIYSTRVSGFRMHIAPVLFRYSSSDLQESQGRSDILAFGSAPVEHCDLACCHRTLSGKGQIYQPVAPPDGNRDSQFCRSHQSANSLGTIILGQKSIIYSVRIRSTPNGIICRI